MKYPQKITAWARAIEAGEGAAAGTNNPGNLKYSGLTASWGARRGRAATDGGNLATFPDYQTGFDALRNFLVLGCENHLIAFHKAASRTLTGFMKIYAGNPPKEYIARIVATLGVDPYIDISTFLC